MPYHSSDSPSELIKKSIASRPTSYENTFASRFDSYYAQLQEKRLQAEYGSSPYGWNSCTQRYDPTPEDQAPSDGRY